MRRALTEPDLPELAGFDHFWERLRLAGGARPAGQPGSGHRIEANAPGTTHDAPPHRRFTLHVGVISSDPAMLRPLLADLHTDDTSFAWILDDDMRVDGRARTYLPWLPAFRERGVHALIGQYEGSSPNPPLNGMRVALVDLLHNIAWLQALDPGVPLPDRSAENQALRAKYPDYYYDLSRKHTGHLEMPHWIEPAFVGETVAQAHARLGAGAVGILSGAPLTRPLVADMPRAPLAAAEDSVNRGGCTFVLDRRALTQTPNVTVRLGGREARRSDMMWRWRLAKRRASLSGPGSHGTGPLPGALQCPRRAYGGARWTAVSRARTARSQDPWFIVQGDNYPETGGSRRAPGPARLR